MIAACVTLSAGSAARARIFVGLVLLALAVDGCAHPAGQPTEVARRFAGAASVGDWDRAYALMSGSYRRRVPLAQFRADMQAEAAAVKADAAALARTSFAPARARVDNPSGEPLWLTLEDGGEWKLEGHPLAPYGQESPRAALRTFIRALERRRYDVLMRLVPRRRRAGVTAESLRDFWEGTASEARRLMIARIKADLGASIVEVGTEAHMPYGTPSGGGPRVGGAARWEEGEGEVDFIFEDGVWRIDDAR